MNLSDVAGIAEKHFAAARLPDLHTAIITGAGQELAIGRPAQRIDAAAVMLVNQQTLADTGVPQAHGLIVAGGGQQLAVGRESDSYGGAGWRGAEVGRV